MITLYMDQIVYIYYYYAYIPIPVLLLLLFLYIFFFHDIYNGYAIVPLAAMFRFDCKYNIYTRNGTDIRV